MDISQARPLIARDFAGHIVPTLAEYVRIPNKSPLFDTDWETHGHMDRAVELLAAWCRRQPIRGLQVEVQRLPGRTPLLWCEIPSSDAVNLPGTVLMYGHFDKQPEFTGWDSDLDPWTPVFREGRLYGRGGADDGYAVFSSLEAIAVLQAQGLPHGRCVILVEGCEESGSADLPFYVDHLADRIGTPDLVVCLDAECGDYDTFWLTTSLRGNITGTLTCEVLTEGVHSGMATGIAPTPVRILRALLDRLENMHTGDVLVESLHVPVPKHRLEQARAAAAVLGESVWRKLPFSVGVEPMSRDPVELLLNSTWKPTITVTGAEGLPPIRNAGNVLLPRVALKLSLRLPPTVDAARAAAAVKDVLERDPPHGARITFKPDSSLSGWHAPDLQGWLTEAVERGSREHFTRDPLAMGTGGSIPFIGMLQSRFPETQFVVTGLLGPKSNAHGPNEFLDVPTAERLTGFVAGLLERHAKATAA